MEHAVRQFSFFKPSSYAEFTHSTLHLISSYFLHKSDPTAQIVQIHQICNTESWPRNDTWKAKEKKNFFLLFFYWLLSLQKPQKCSDAFTLSAVNFVQCSIFTEIVRLVSHYWSRRIGNRKGVIPKGILLASSSSSSASPTEFLSPAPKHLAVLEVSVLCMQIWVVYWIASMCFQLQLISNLCLKIRIFWTQICPYTLLVQSWTHLEAIWKLYPCSWSMYVTTGDLLATKKVLHCGENWIAPFLAVILTLILLCSSLKVLQRDHEVKYPGWRWGHFASPICQAKEVQWTAISSQLLHIYSHNFLCIIVVFPSIA